MKNTVKKERALRESTIAASARGRKEINAEDQAVGRLATEAARYLIGKHKATYAPHIDAGDFVTITNASKVKFTGRKLAQKDYYHHTMHPGGIKRMPMKHLFVKDPGAVIKHAIYGMLPKTQHREAMYLRLTITP